jgi:hypothetical protein
MHLRVRVRAHIATQTTSDLDHFAGVIRSQLSTFVNECVVDEESDVTFGARTVGRVSVCVCATTGHFALPALMSYCALAGGQRGKRLVCRGQVSQFATKFAQVREHVCVLV